MMDLEEDFPMVAYVYDVVRREIHELEDLQLGLLEWLQLRSAIIERYRE